MKKICVIAVSLALAFTSLAGRGNALGSNGAAPQSPSVTTIYLPLVSRSLPQVFGVETTYIDPNLLNKAEGVDTYWWRYSAFSWKAIEPNDVDPSQYNWGAVDDQELISAAQRGFSIVAVVKNTPYWAQAINDPNSIPCSPIKNDPATIADFIEFIQALATRYSAPPFNIRYWQFWNEPDVSPQLLGSSVYTSQYGCWGDESDLNYYGGEYYADFLQTFAETIKSVDPNAIITNGGLLLDCDPTQNPSCLPGKFFEGVIKELQAKNALQDLDYASFHVYNRWYVPYRLSLDESDPVNTPFYSRGGVLLGKADFVREVMTNYGITPPKPLLVTEAGLQCSGTLVCNDPLPPQEFTDDQADYIVWTYVRAVADGISGVMWYTLNYQPWRHIGLLWSDGSPKPAYQVYQYMVSLLGKASFAAILNQYSPTLRAYEFWKDDQRIWVMWSPDQLDHTINLPAGFQAAFDEFGSQISLPPNPTSITINRPIYLILSP